MKLTASEEYGLRCLLQVAQLAPHSTSPPASIREIAEREGLSPDYAAKLLRLLRKEGMITSERGAAGGYRLARPAHEISAAQVLAVFDDPLYSESFCQKRSGKLDDCIHAGGCRVGGLWRKVTVAITSVLEGVTLAELTDPCVPSREEGRK